MPEAPGRTLVADLVGRSGGRVRVCGWIDRADEPAEGEPVAVRDHSGAVPLVGAADAAGAPPLVPGSAVEVTGHLRAGPDGGSELVVERLAVVGPALDRPPVDASSPLEQRLDWRYLDLRHPRNRLIFAVQTTAERAMRALWAERGFIELHSPKLRATPNKSGDELFPVDYFGRRAYLAQSPQFSKQMAMAAGFDRVFEIGPVFRAQGDPTSRHDTEFTSVDIEVSWIDSMDDLLTHEEELLRRSLTAVRDEHGEDIQRRFGVEVRVPSTPFPRVTLEEAKAIVASRGGHVGATDDDLDPQGERLLADHVATEHDHEFVFVTDYPERSRPFYHLRCDDRPPATHSFDLLWKGLEITSGAQREHRYERLVDQARSHGIPVPAIRGYLDFFRHGCPPHGGFGLGLTRMLMSLLGLGDVREVTYLFRGPERLTP